MKNFFKPPKPVVRLTAFLLFGCCLLPELVLAQEERIRVETAVHLHSRYSFIGKLSLEEILKHAKDKGIDALLFTDHALVKISYGLFPFRRLLRISVQKDSVFKKGLHRYLNEIKALNQKYPDLLLIPALEVAPFYYWEKSPLTQRGVVRDWNKHLLVMGLDEKGFRSLPLMGHGSVPLRPFRLTDLFRAWGALAIALGVVCYRKKAFDYRDETGRNLSPPSTLFRAIGWTLLLIGGVSLIENYPYRQPAFNIYSPDEKILPYQTLIDDVQKKGGLVFWAHPEGRTIPYEFSPVTFLTDPYPQALIETKNYTGFAIFFEGFKTIGPPGGIWDQLLLEYCRGKRQRPIWAIGELDYSEEGKAMTWIDTVKTIVFSRERSQEAFLEAMKEGRMVAVRRSQEGEIVFGDFWVEDAQTGRRAHLGETLWVESFPKIGVSLSQIGTVPDVRIRLIRDGETIREKKSLLPIDETYEDPGFQSPLSYYRFEVQSDGGQLLATNPIFVSRKR